MESDGTPLVMWVVALGPSTPDSLRRVKRQVELFPSLDTPHGVRVESALAEQLLPNARPGVAVSRDTVYGWPATPSAFGRFTVA